MPRRLAFMLLLLAALTLTACSSSRRVDRPIVSATYSAGHDPAMQSAAATTP